MYKLAIFDLDGTLLDTLEDLTDSVNYALNINNFPQRTIEEVREFLGNGIKNLIERAVPENTNAEIIEKVLDDFKLYYSLHCADKTKVYAGINSLLSSLNAAGFKLAVLSNKADFLVQQLCSKYFPQTFDYVAGEQDGVRKKTLSRWSKLHYGKDACKPI